MSNPEDPTGVPTNQEPDENSSPAQNSILAQNTPPAPTPPSSDDPCSRVLKSISVPPSARNSPVPDVATAKLEMQYLNGSGVPPVPPRANSAGSQSSPIRNPNVTYNLTPQRPVYGPNDLTPISQISEIGFLGRFASTLGSPESNAARNAEVAGACWNVNPGDMSMISNQNERSLDVYAPGSPIQGGDLQFVKQDQRDALPFNSTLPNASFGPRPPPPPTPPPPEQSPVVVTLIQDPHFKKFLSQTCKFVTDKLLQEIIREMVGDLLPKLLGDKITEIVPPIAQSMLNRGTVPNAQACTCPDVPPNANPNQSRRSNADRGTSPINLSGRQNAASPRNVSGGQNNSYGGTQPGQFSASNVVPPSSFNSSGGQNNSYGGTQPGQFSASNVVPPSSFNSSGGPYDSFVFPLSPAPLDLSEGPNDSFVYPLGPALQFDLSGGQNNNRVSPRNISGGQNAASPRNISGGQNAASPRNISGGQNAASPRNISGGQNDSFVYPIGPAPQFDLSGVQIANVSSPRNLSGRQNEFYGGVGPGQLSINDDLSGRQNASPLRNPSGGENTSCNLNQLFSNRNEPLYNILPNYQSPRPTRINYVDYSTGTDMSWSPRPDGQNPTTQMMIERIPDPIPNFSQPNHPLVTRRAISPGGERSAVPNSGPQQSFLPSQRPASPNPGQRQQFMQPQRPASPNPGQRQQFMQPQRPASPNPGQRQQFMQPQRPGSPYPGLPRSQQQTDLQGARCVSPNRGEQQMSGGGGRPATPNSLRNIRPFELGEGGPEQGIYPNATALDFAPEFNSTFNSSDGTPSWFDSNGSDGTEYASF